MSSVSTSTLCSDFLIVLILRGSVRSTALSSACSPFYGWGPCRSWNLFFVCIWLKKVQKGFMVSTCLARYWAAVSDCRRGFTYPGTPRDKESSFMAGSAREVAPFYI